MTGSAGPTVAQTGAPLRITPSIRLVFARALYVTPHHQYPTTAVLPAGRRMRLLELAARYGIAVIEDDYDHEFHYDGRARSVCDPMRLNGGRPGSWRQREPEEVRRPLSPVVSASDVRPQLDHA